MSFRKKNNLNKGFLIDLCRKLIFKIQNENLHHIILYQIKKEARVGRATTNIQDVYLCNASTLRIVKKWFSLFQTSDVYLSDIIRSGRT